MAGWRQRPRIGMVASLDGLLWLHDHASPAADRKRSLNLPLAGSPAGDWSCGGPRHLLLVILKPLGGKSTSSAERIEKIGISQPEKIFLQGRLVTRKGSTRSETAGCTSRFPHAVGRKTAVSSFSREGYQARPVSPPSPQKSGFPNEVCGKPIASQKLINSRL